MPFNQTEAFYKYDLPICQLIESKSKPQKKQGSIVSLHQYKSNSDKKGVQTAKSTAQGYKNMPEWVGAISSILQR